MKIKNLLACALISLIAVSPMAAMAEDIKPGSPTPTPIATPEPTPEPTPEATEEITELEAEPTPEPKPGDEKPKPVGSISIQASMSIGFPTPHSLGKANFSNPDGATSSIVYLLRISVAELLNKTGMTGYTEEEYAEMSATLDFDPERCFIILCQTEPLAPGEAAEEIMLTALPNGQLLPAGTYSVEVDSQPVQVEQDESQGVQASISVSLQTQSSIVIESDSMTLTVELVDGQQVVGLHVFNPVNSAKDMIYGIQFSQLEIQNVTGSPHRTEEELIVQAADVNFLPEYEFVSVFESEPVKPGEALKHAELARLPDGRMLPPGTYHGWLVKYAIDSETQEKIQQNATTEIELVVPESAFDETVVLPDDGVAEILTDAEALVEEIAPEVSE